MDRAEVVAAVFSPPPTPIPVPRPTVDASPGRRLRDAIEPLAMHSVWCEGTGDAMEALGLDFLGAYVGARAGLLGDCDPAVAVASFAVFEPSMLRATLEQARSVRARAELLSARDAATIESLRGVLDGVDTDEIADAAAHLRRAVDGADAMARPLFAGVVALGWPDDDVGVLWRACEAVREHRGDGHSAACATAGVGALRANLLTETWVGMSLGSYTATRGWAEPAIAAEAESMRAEGLLDGDELSAAGRDLRDGIERATDAAQQVLVDALGDDLEGLLDRLGDWSARCVDARAFPPDPFKRAAG
ncbi:SCO6745 family protein [Ilumatobacter sp.]|uniref:SCO6745 family protein n=1 Tax=Ilumatobacter sp. TaxID=1967498 RepID=UPI003B528D00